jgi:plasmid rolling circle replication initiator protein Rep
VEKQGMISINENVRYTFLEDFNSKGGQRNWQQKKERNLLLADVLHMNMMDGISFKVRNCGTMLEFRRYDDGKSKLAKGNFCKVRLCPLCNWRRSNKIFGQVSRIMEYLQTQYDYRFVFITLTVKNCVGSDLSSTIKKLLYDFQNLVKLKSFDCFKGFIRVLEVTYSKKDDTYHPHLHCIFAVNKSYFKKSDYISHKKLRMIWRDVCGLDYLPQCSIEKVKNKETGEDSGKAINSAVAECTKYAVKETDYLEIYRDKERKIRDIHRICLVVDTLYRAMNNIKLLGLGGCFKQAKEALHLGDAEDGSLCDELRSDVKYVIEKYQWSAGLKNYVLIERKYNVDIVCEDEEA